jgi:hypothetical protein
MNTTFEFSVITGTKYFTNELEKTNPSNRSERRNRAKYRAFKKTNTTRYR